MRRNIIKVVIGISLFAGMIFSYSCFQGKKENRASISKSTILIAKIESVFPLPGGETASRKRWQIKLQITEVVFSDKNEINKGDRVTLFVHSAIKTFGADVKDIKGSSYEIEYLQNFSHIYKGDLIIRDIN